MESIWSQLCHIPQRPPLPGGLHTEVAVIGAGLAGIMFFWVFGKKYVCEELQKGRREPLPAWIYPLSKYVYCVLTALVFVLGIVIPGGIG